MALYVLASMVAVVFTLALAYWTLSGVEKKYPEPVLKQMIAGCWFFGVGAIMCLLAAPLINIVEVKAGVTPADSPVTEVIAAEVEVE